jgi:hypothetical protein
LPNVAFQWLFGIAVTGQYSLAQRVLAQPTVLLGQAVNQVFWGAASRLSVQDPARLWPLFLRLNLGLFAAMAPGFVLSWYGAEIFSFVFGPAWAQAGGFAGAMIVASFVGLPAQGTTSLHVYGLNHWMGAWEVLQLLLVAGALLAAAQFELTPAQCVVAVSAALALANAILLGLNALALRLAPRRRQVEPPSAGLVPVVEARR